jgi:heat shock protein HslJ
MKSDQLIVFVNAYKAPCVGVAAQECFVVHNEDSEEKQWNYWHTAIEGFAFEEGFKYRLQLRKEVIPKEDVPADGSSIKYYLEEVLEKTPFTLKDLEGKWELTQIDGADFEAAGRKQPMLQFNAEELKVMGSDGCNRLMGSIEHFKTSSLKFGPLASTKMACPDLVYTATIAQYLTSTASFIYYNNTLVIKTIEGSTLTYIRKA